MLRHAVVIAAVAINVILVCPPLQAQSAGDPTAGLEVAHRWCSNCHVVDARQQTGSDAVPTFAMIARKPTTTATSLKAFLQMPHYASRMPEFQIASTDIDNLAAYVLSLR
jgi:mono/diheme cytochrome c family protein